MTSALQASHPIPQIGEAPPPAPALNALQTKIAAVFNFCIHFLLGYLSTLWELVAFRNNELDRGDSDYVVIEHEVPQDIDAEIAAINQVQHPPIFINTRETPLDIDAEIATMCGEAARCHSV